MVPWTSRLALYGTVAIIAILCAPVHGVDTTRPTAPETKPAKPMRVRPKNAVDTITLAYNSALQYAPFLETVEQMCTRINEHVGVIQIPDGDGGVLYEVDWRVTPDTVESIGG